MVLCLHVCVRDRDRGRERWRGNAGEKARVSKKVTVNKYSPVNLTDVRTCDKLSGFYIMSKNVNSGENSIFVVSD